MKALVTGGAGFIGSTLVDRLLAEGHAVDVIDDLSGGTLANLADARGDRSAELHIHQVDIRSGEVIELIARRAPDVVFHLAGSPSDDAATAALVDVVGSLHVFEGARAGGARKVVFAAGWSLYGDPEPDVLPLRESAVQAPVVARGSANKAVLEYLRLYRERYHVEFTALALASVYGPRQRPGRGVVATFAQSLLHGGRPVTVEGDGSQTRDFLYVDDAVDALVRAAERGSGLLVNVGRGVQTSVRSLLAMMADAAGMADVAPVTAPLPDGAVARMALDPGRAKIQLGWEPWTSLEEGVAQTLRWHAAAIRS